METVSLPSLGRGKRHAYTRSSPDLNYGNILFVFVRWLCQICYLSLTGGGGIGKTNQCDLALHKFSAKSNLRNI